MDQRVCNVKEPLRAYWAGQLAQSQRFRYMLGATNVELIDRHQLDPSPDALFELSYSEGESKKLWCEISGTWSSEADEQEVYEVAAGKRRPPTGTGQVVHDSDARTADSVINAIMKERGGDSYRGLKSKLGSGHLHLLPSCAHHALFNQSTLSRISSCLPVEELEDQDMFRSISFGHHDQVYCLWTASDSLDSTP